MKNQNENLLIKFDENGFNSEIDSLKGTINEIQKVIQTYNSLRIGEFELDDFNGLFFNTEFFIFEKIMKDKPAEFLGMKVDKRKFYDDYLVKPLGYNALLEAMELFKKIVGFKLRNLPEGITYRNFLLDYFNILPNCKFELKESKIDEIKKQHETYVCTERGKLAYEFANLINDFVKNKGKREKLRINDRQDLERFAGEAISFISGYTSVRTDFITFMDR